MNHERDALLTFKNGIEHDDCGLLSSWGVKEDCCEWRGIRCSNLTGHVIALNLEGNGYRQPCLSGNIDPSLFELKYLKYLDLSFNNFYQLIPKSIDSLTNLEHLKLSFSFFGEIPHQLGNLSRLLYLDLSSEKLAAKSLEWLSRLSQLRYIGFSGNDLSKVTNWAQIVNNLPHLSTVNMYSCDLPPVYPSLSYLNSSTTLQFIDLAMSSLNDTSVFQWLFNLTRIGNQIEYLDLSWNSLRGLMPSGFGNMYLLSTLLLSHNYLEGLIPESFSKLKFLRHLDLGHNHLQGSILKPLRNKCNLEYLDLSSNNFVDDLSNVLQTLSIGCTNKPLLEHLILGNNQLWGSIPDLITSFSSLRELYLESNTLNGTISQGIGQLSMLQSFVIMNNSLEGILNHTHFLNLSRLINLSLSENRGLVLNVDVDWKPPFQLNIIHLRYIKLGPSFPKWLLTQTNVSHLDISFTEISDSIPSSFWANSLSSSLENLNVSHNEIEGEIPNLSITFISDYIDFDLSSNYFRGPIPAFLGKSSLSLYLNNNLFTDSRGLLSKMNQSNLFFLDLSNNSLSGELPDCWMNFNQLDSLHLENNKFSGNVPTSIGSLTQLRFLHLGNNSFSGVLPISLKNCTSLITLDVGHNLLTGNIPSRIGYAFPHLIILILRKNNFYGSLPPSLCQLSNLHIMDFGINHISGTIPKCFNGISEMINNTDLDGMWYPYDYKTPELDDEVNTETTIFEWKKEDQRLGETTGYYILIDLSYNNLQGKIPDEIYRLKGLVSLDLSRNNLSGIIASNIGELTSLQMLDLSNNHLSGEIPEGLAKLNFLGILDLSNNNLSGKIPLSTQLQSFNTSSYFGNPLLCGLPLPYCPGDEPSTKTLSRENQHDEQGSDNIYPGLYLSVMLGFIIGFWGICGILVVKRSWRHAFFLFFDNMKDKLNVMWVFKSC